MRDQCRAHHRPYDVWSHRFSAFFFPKHINTQISLIHRLQFKKPARRSLSHTHYTAPFALLPPKNSTHHHATHRIFAATHSRAVRFCRSVHLRCPIFPARFFTTDAWLPRLIALNCDRFQTKSQKMRVIGGKQAKIVAVQALPIRLSSKQNTQNRQSHTTNAAI